MNILLIEPDQELGTVVEHFLIVKGYMVARHHTAQAAVLAADNHKPDVVILELAIPAHNGIAFLHEFRSYGDWTSVPVIIYSHLPRESSGLSAREWQKYGVEHYLYKPTSRLETLLQAIKSYQIPISA